MNLYQFLWQRIALFLRLAPPEGGGMAFPMDVELARSLHSLAEEQQRPDDEVAAELLSYALAQREVFEEQIQRWNRLSEREQQVAALICLRNTNRQIASRLHLSPETVKTHVRNVLFKFDLRSKSELRQVLAGWDFSAWRN